MSTSHELVESVRPLLAEAQGIFEEIAEIEGAIRRNYDLLFAGTWRLGQKLSEIKAEVGHGRWLFWLGANWAEIDVRKAQLCMQFFAANPEANTSNLTHFSVESIRKLMGGYIPAKVRPQLDGDAPVKPSTHHLTFVNHFSKWDRQLQIEHIPAPEIEVLRRDCEPVARRMIELLGREYFAGLLEGE